MTSYDVLQRFESVLHNSVGKDQRRESPQQEKTTAPWPDKFRLKDSRNCDKSRVYFQAPEAYGGSTLGAMMKNESVTGS
jgi:hypothetical protein